MYQYSLDWFKSIYEMSFKAGEEIETEIEKRIEQLMNEFNLLLYGTICRSIYEKHKLIFAFFIAVELNMEEINSEILWFLLTGLSTWEIEDAVNPLQDSISDKVYD